MKVTEKNKVKNKKGITLISLIVTIIVLLLLTGIPIVMMVGEDGIIQKSHEAKHSVEQAEEQKDLDLKLSEYVLEKETTDVEINDFVDRLEDEGKVKDHTQNDDGSYDIETDDGYSAEVRPDPDNPGDTIVEVEGKTNELKPKITALYLSSTTNSITVRIKMNIRRKNATYNILYRPKEGDIEGEEIDEEEYQEAYQNTLIPEKYTNGEEILYTIHNLQQNTKYDIKVQATNDMGTDEQTGDITTREIPNADDTEQGIQIGKVTWNDDGTANLHVEKGHGETVDDKDIKVQYRIKRNGVYVNSNDGNEGWKDVTGGKTENLELWDEIELRYSDGVNVGPSTSTKIKDENKPNVQIKVTDTTTSTITVQTDITDGESGFDENVTYTYYIKKNSEETYSEENKKQITAKRGDAVRSASNTYTFTKLEQTTNFDIKVVVQDRANNENEAKTSSETKTMPKGDSATEGIGFSDIQWNPTTHQATITASKRNTTTIYKIRYRKNEEPNKDDYTEIDGNEGTIEGLSLNDTVYAKLWDGTNYGSSATIKITDGGKPEVTVEVQEEKTSKITVKATAIDKEAGLPENVEFIYYIKEKNNTESQYEQKGTKSVINFEKTKNQGGIATEDAYTFDKLKQNTEYQIKVTVKDRKPNIGEGTQDGRTIGLPSASDGSNGIQVGNPEWKEDGNANIPVQKGGKAASDSDVKIQYKIGSDTTWRDLPSDNKVPNVGLNQNVQLRYSDGTNTGGEKTTTLSDPTPPQVTINTTVQKTNSLTVTTNVTDNEAGLPEQVTYNYYIKEQSETEYKNKPAKIVTRGSNVKTSSDTYIFEGLKQKTTYDIKVEVADKTPNKGNNTTKGTTLEMPSAMDHNNGLTVKDPVWKGDGTAELPVEKKGTNDYQIQYKVGNGEWQNLPTTGNTGNVPNLHLRDTVELKLWDGINGGATTSKTIEEKEAPKVTVSKTGKTTNSISVSVEAKDLQSGFPDSVEFKYYIRQSGTNTWPAAKETRTRTKTNIANASDSYTFTGLTQTTNYEIKVEVTDNANNKGEGINNETTETMPTGTGNITLQGPTWDTKAHTATVQVSTSQTGYTIRYWTSKNPAQHQEIKNNETITVKDNNTTVYAELWDGVNTSSSSSAVSMTINDTTGPAIDEPKITTTTKGITIETKANDVQFGMPDTPTYNFYIKKSNEAYQSRPDSTSNNGTCTFTDKDQETTYNIKIEVSDHMGNSNTIERTAQTKKMPKATDRQNGVTIAEPKWNPAAHNASVVISKNNSGDGYILEYNLGDGNWKSANSGPYTATVSDNTTVSARLSDGKNVGEQTSKLIKDNTVPTVAFNYSVKTNSITASISSANDEQSGLETSPKFSYYIKESASSSWSEPTTTTEKNHTFSGLTQDTTYSVKVEVKDLGNNTGNSTQNIKTLPMPDANSSTGGLTFGSESWSGGKATVTVTKIKGDDGYNIQYKDSSGQWKNGGTGASCNISNIPHGTTVSARLWDGTNNDKNFGKEMSKIIKDVTPPTVTVKVESVTTNSLNISYTVKDGQSGVPQNPSINIEYQKANTTNWSSTTGTGSLQNGEYKGTAVISKLQTGTYKVKVSSNDVAGVRGESTVDGQTAAMPDVNQSIKFGSVTWTPSTHKATVIITSSADSKFKIYYGTDPNTITTLIDNGKATNPVNYNANVYAQLDDGVNRSGSASTTIADKEKPNAATINITTTNIKKGQNMSATVTQTDGQSGVKIDECRWALTQSNTALGIGNSIYTGRFNKESETITQPMSEKGTYYLHVLTVDYAGNKLETVSSSSVTVKAAETAADLKDQTNGSNSDGSGSVIGKKVTGLYAPALAFSGDWLLFDVFDDHVYLISGDALESDDWAERCWRTKS